MRFLVRAATTLFIQLWGRGAVLLIDVTLYDKTPVPPSKAVGGQLNVYSDILRAALAGLRAKRDRRILEWEMALRVQAAWHGKRGRMVVLAMRILMVSGMRKCFHFFMAEIQQDDACSYAGTFFKAKILLLSTQKPFWAGG